MKAAAADGANAAAGKRHERNPGRSIRVGAVAPHERERLPIRLDPGLAVPNESIGEAPGHRHAPAIERDRVQPRHVAIAEDRPSGDDRDPPIGGDIELLDDRDRADIARFMGRSGRAAIAEQGRWAPCRRHDRPAYRRYASSMAPSELPSVRDRLVIAPEVAAALGAGLPVVALESTLISHGLPHPANVEVARASEAAVRAAGATPATVAIRDGRILIGLADSDLEALATAPAGSVRKAARPSLAIALEAGGWAATTVSATMIAAEAAGIRVFATGGIGGVHRGALGASSPGSGGPSFDISSDLEELARTPMAVVCAGPKAILDVPATVQYLETRGVPVVAIGQAELPGFYARSRACRPRHRCQMWRPRRRWLPPISVSVSAAPCSCASPSRRRRPCRPTRSGRRSSGPSTRPTRRASAARPSPRGSSAASRS